MAESKWFKHDSAGEVGSYASLLHHLKLIENITESFILAVKENVSR